MNEKTIIELLKDHESKHSNFQIINFIVGGCLGDWARYKQCLREIESRYKILKTNEDELAIYNLDKKSIKRKLKLMLLGKARRELIINREKRLESERQEHIKHTKRELDEFVKIAKELKESIGELDNGKRELLEADSWYQKARQLAAVEIMVTGAPSKSTFEFILSLPKETGGGY